MDNKKPQLRGWGGGLGLVYAGFFLFLLIGLGLMLLILSIPIALFKAVDLLDGYARIMVLAKNNTALILLLSIIIIYLRTFVS